MTAIFSTARARRSVLTPLRDIDSASWPIAAIATMLIAQFSLIFTHAINWDEFYHFGQLYDLETGRQLNGLQPLYLRPYVWIARLDWNSVDRIVLARIGEFACELVTLTMTVVTARRFVDLTTACLATLTHLITGYVLQHGFAFRADPMVTAVLMTALAIFTRRQLDWMTVLATGILTGVAAMLSIKAVLYTPVFAGVAFLHLRDARRSSATVGKLASIALVASLTFPAVYSVHQGLMPPAPAQGGKTGGQRSLSLVGSAAHHMFFIGRPNNLGMIVNAMMTGLAMTTLIVLAPYAIMKHKGIAGERVALAGFLSLVLTPLFYENTAAYFYVFMLAPVAVATGVSLNLIRKRVPSFVIAVLLVSLASSVVIMENRKVIDNQRRLLDEIASMFPQPIAYFDHADMIAHFDKKNPFQTPWGYKGYLAKRVPVYRNAMEAGPVPLLIPNWRTFGELLSGNDEHFLSDDAKALRENYLPFNGPIWLAGKALEPGQAIRSEFLVPGKYTVRDAPVKVDDIPYTQGDIVTIDRGFHRLSATGDRPVRLVWGERIVERDSLGDMHTWVAF